MKEQLIKSIYILTYNAKKIEVNFWFCHFGKTINRHLHHVLRAIFELEEKCLVQPDDSKVFPKIGSSNISYHYLKVNVVTNNLPYKQILK